MHQDEAVWLWYGEERPNLEWAEQRAVGDCWRSHGVYKWIAYDRVSGEVVGRGGLSRTPVNDDWGRIYSFLPNEPWVRAQYVIGHSYRAHAHWLEIGWALRHKSWGEGYASEIGRAGLEFAFAALGAEAVVSCTERRNVRSRAVMEQVGMRYAGELRASSTAKGVEQERDEIVCVLLRREWGSQRR